MSFTNHIQQIIARAMTNLGNVRLGYVSGSTPPGSTITVTIQPENVEVGPIPYATPWIGWFAPPTPGQQCIVIFQEGSKNVPLGALVLYDDAHLPPVNVAAGEAILYHSTGAYLKASNDGSIAIVTAKANAPLNLTVAGVLNATVTGDVTVTTSANADITASSGEITLTAPTINLNGNVVVSGELTANNGGITMSGSNFSTNGDVTAQGISLHGHVHGGVTTGGSNTGAPV